MNVVRSAGQENLVYVLLTDAEVPVLRRLLKRPLKVTPAERELAKRMRADLKAVEK